MATAQEISGMGRDELVAIVNRLQLEAEAFVEVRTILADEVLKAQREVKALTDNVTALQARGTAAVVADRLDRALTEDPALCATILDVVWAVGRARKVHPEGCSLLAVMQEVGESARALEREDADRYRSELLDAAAVVVRMLVGDVDPRLAPVEPFARRPR